MGRHADSAFTLVVRVYYRILQMYVLYLFVHSIESGNVSIYQIDMHAV